MASNSPSSSDANAPQNENLLSTATVGRLFKLSENSVINLARRGVIHRARDERGHELSGRYSLVQVVQDYTEFLRHEAYGRGSSETTWRTEKTRLVKAQRQKAELELAISRGSVVLVRDVEGLTGVMLANFRSRLLAIPSNVARLVQYAKDLPAIVDILTESLLEVLAELRQLGPQDFLEYARVARASNGDEEQDDTETDELGDIESEQAP